MNRLIEMGKSPAPALDKGENRNSGCFACLKNA